MPGRHIVAMGGGGFSDGGPLLDDFLLSLTDVERPRVCFVPTASGDSASYVERFYAAFAGGRADPTHLSLFQSPYPEIRRLVDAQDVIYVGGGSTANLLAVWRLHGVDEVVRRAYERGVVLVGISAGALCWFEGGVTDSLGPALAPLCDGLGLLSGTFCPHFDSEPDRRGAYHRFIREGRLGAGLAADDGVALHFVDGRLAEVVADRRDVLAYSVAAEGGAVAEERIVPRVLGAGT